MWGVAPSQRLHVPRHVCTVKSMGQSRQCTHDARIQELQSVSSQAQTSSKTQRQRDTQQGAEALKPITREIVSARNTWHYARDKGYVDKAEFYFEYMGLLMHEKTHAEMSHMLKPSRPPSSRWADYISPAVFTRVRDMWAALPPVYKHSKIPLLITYRPDGE